MIFEGMQVFFFNFFAGVFRPWMTQVFTDEWGVCSAIPSSYLDPEVPPSGHGDRRVQGRMGMNLSGENPRAIGWVCSAYLNLLHPVGCRGKRGVPPGTNSDKEKFPVVRWAWRPPGTELLQTHLSCHISFFRGNLRNRLLYFGAMGDYFLRVGGNCNSFGGRPPCSIKVLTAWQRCSEERLRHLSG